MHRHDDLVRIEFEDEIGMSGGDQLVVDIFLGGADMAGEALLGARGEIGKIVEAELDVLFVL